MFINGFVNRLVGKIIQLMFMRKLILYYYEDIISMNINYV